MKRIPAMLMRSLVVVLICSGAFALNLQAQNGEAITVEIKFPFTVGTQVVAPGTYQFSRGEDQFLLNVLNVNTGKVKIFNVWPALQPSVEQQGSVTFRHTAGGSALNEVHFPGTDTFSEISQKHADRRTEKMQAAIRHSIAASH